jgi:hypothetical protein
MRVKLDLHDPSTHWIALAGVIERNPDLPDDAVLIVRKDGVMLCEHVSSGHHIEIARRNSSETSVNDLKGKLAFLEWVHDHFATSAR